MHGRVNPSPAPSARSKLSTSFVKAAPSSIQVDAIKLELSKHIKNEMTKALQNTIQTIMKQDPSISMLSGNSFCSVQPTKSISRTGAIRDNNKANNSQILMTEREKYELKSAQALPKTSAWKKVSSVLPKQSRSQVRITRPMFKNSKLELKPTTLFEKKVALKSPSQPPKKDQTLLSFAPQISSNKNNQVNDSSISKEMTQVNPSSTSENQKLEKEPKSCEQLMSEFLQAFNQLKEGLGDDNVSKEIKGMISKLNSRDSTREINDIGASSFEDFLSLRHLEKLSDKKIEQVENPIPKALSEILSTREIQIAEFNSAEKQETFEELSFHSSADEVITDMERAKKFNRIIEGQEQAAPQEEATNISADQRYELLKKAGYHFTFERKDNVVRESDDLGYQNTPFF